MQCMVALLARSGLADALAADLPNTYFLPTDSAFLMDLGVRCRPGLAHSGLAGGLVEGIARWQLERLVGGFDGTARRQGCQASQERRLLQQLGAAAWMSSCTGS